MGAQRKIEREKKDKRIQGKETTCMCLGIKSELHKNTMRSISGEWKINGGNITKTEHCMSTKTII